MTRRWPGGRYESEAPPTVTGVCMRAGSTAGGDMVVVQGTELAFATSVSFGGVPATIVSVGSDQVMFVREPAHPLGLVDVVVTNVAGSSPSSLQDEFVYLPAPSLPPTGCPSPY